MNESEVIAAYGTQNADRIRQALGAAGATPSDAKPDRLRLTAPPPELVLTEPPDEKAARKVRHLEAAEQMDYMDRVRRCLDPEGRALPAYPGADLIFALANENAAGRAIGVVRWKMGVKAGLCDIGVFVPRGGYHGAFIEMKQSSGVASDVRPAQRECIEALSRAGYRPVVAYGSWDAWKFTCDYLGWDL